MKCLRLALFVAIGLLAPAAAIYLRFGPISGAEYLGREGVTFQRDINDCGAAALEMILGRHGIRMDYGQLAQRLQTNASGTTMLNMRELARAEGLACEGWRLAARDLAAIPLPAVLLTRRHHFVVLDQVDSGGALIRDPARGRLRLSLRKLSSMWQGESLLFFKPGAAPGRPGGWFAHSQNTQRK